MAQLGFADMDDGPGTGGAMIVRAGDQPADLPKAGLVVRRLATEPGSSGSMSGLPTRPRRTERISTTAS